MRGIAFAFVAITFVATTPHPVAAQCYGPECDRQRSSPPAYYNERQNFHSNPAQGAAVSLGTVCTQGSRDRRQPPVISLKDRTNSIIQGPTLSRPINGLLYQAQPRPPMDYADMPPGV